MARLNEAFFENSWLNMVGGCCGSTPPHIAAIHATIKAKGFKRPEELSGGEQQRVAVCLALVNDPPIILADEPTGNLDSHNAKVISSMLIDLATSRGKTVLVASHDSKVVEQFPRVYHMRDGAVQQVT
jgi:ABC-type lipoprotein export system ATPase subunit